MSHTAKQYKRRRRGLGLVELLACLSISSLLLTATGVAYYASFNSYRDNLARGSMLSAGRSALTAIVRDLRMAERHWPFDPSASVFSAVKLQYDGGIVPGYPNSGLLSANGSGSKGIVLVKMHPDMQDPNVIATNSATYVSIYYWYDATSKQIKTWRQTYSYPITQPSGATVVCSGVQSFAAFLQPVYIPFDPNAVAVTGHSELSLGYNPQYDLQQAVVNISLANLDANGNAVYLGGKQVTMALTEAAAPRRNFGTH